MATYRPFHVGFWDDPDIEPFLPDEKLVYAFLFTNRLTTESGIYSISEKFIAERTGITPLRINTILDTLQNTYHKITYDKNIVFVHGFMRRNFKGSPEKLELSILSNVTDHPSILCWTKFLEIYSSHHICNKIKVMLKSSQCVVDTSIAIAIGIELELEEKKQIRQESTIQKFVPPSIDDMISYFAANGFPDDLARRAYAGYAAANWHDSYGNKIKNWKQKAQHVWFKPESKIKKSNLDIAIENMKLKGAIRNEC